jgi:hypothetical protein
MGIGRRSDQGPSVPAAAETEKPMTRTRMIAAIGLLLVLSACATQPNHQLGNPQGFLLGLLHGFIVVFSLIASFFTDVRVYTYPNTGIYYDCGFVLGVALFFGGGAGGFRR